MVNHSLVDNDWKIEFNISHSGDWVVAALSNHPIGIDIEAIKPIDHSNIVNRFFSKEEADFFNRIEEAEDHLSHFYKFWRMKESFLKLLGTGLHFPLDKVRIYRMLGNAHYTVHKGENYYFHQYLIDKDYIISLCTTSKTHSAQVKLYSSEGLIKMFPKENTEVGRIYIRNIRDVSQ